MIYLTVRKDGQIIIFDFGGGTFDVCLVNIEEGIKKTVKWFKNNYNKCRK